MTSYSTNHPLIRAKEAEIEVKRRELELMEAELRGMRALLSHPQSILPASPTLESDSGVFRIQEGTATSKGYKGRQPGAISKTWRAILSELYWQGGRSGQIGATFNVDRAIQAAQKQGIQLRPSEAQARLTHYEEFDYVGAVDGGFRVSLNAAIKFGFDKSPLKDEAPAENPEGAS